MKVDVTVAGSGDLPRRLADRMRILSADASRRLERELQEELQSVDRSERAADPETRRDALERAVRRVWGATL
jgi:hypothetical protein